MIKGEMNAFYPKYLDKDGEKIEVGDVLFGGDGRRWKIIGCIYSCNGNKKHEIIGQEVTPVGSRTGQEKPLRPKWLSRQNPNATAEVKQNKLKKWHDDLTCAIAELPVGSYPLKTLFSRVRDDIKQYIKDDYEDYI